MEHDLLLDFHQQHKRSEKPLNLGRDHGFTAPTLWASVGYFRFTSALNHSSYFPPNILEGFDLWNPICFLNYVAFGLFFPLLIYSVISLLSFMGFGISPVWVPLLASYLVPPHHMTYLFFLDLPSYHFYSSVNPWTPHTANLLIFCFPTAWALRALTDLNIPDWPALGPLLIPCPRAQNPYLSSNLCLASAML